MWGLRRQVSLLVANGHPDAPLYPVHRVWEEAFMLTSQMNLMMATNAMLTQMAVSSLFSKDAGRDFTKTIKDMT